LPRVVSTASPSDRTPIPTTRCAGAPVRRCAGDHVAALDVLERDRNLKRISTVIVSYTITPDVADPDSSPATPNEADACHLT
jgi:hypothetical protein